MNAEKSMRRSNQARRRVLPQAAGLLASGSIIVSGLLFSNADAVEPIRLYDPINMSTAFTIADEGTDKLDLDLDREELGDPNDLDLGDLDLSVDDELDVDGIDDVNDDAYDDEDGGGQSRLTRSIFGNEGERVPQVEDGRFSLPPLQAPTTDTSQIGNGRLPEDFRGGVDTPVMALPESLFDRGLPASWTVRNWVAPNTFSHPLYFQDRMLERHGHERFPMLTPLASGARFFATIPMLPYLSVISPPCDCQYTLGYYRAGSCAPVMLQRPPYERRAVIAEAAVIAGTAIALP